MHRLIARLTGQENLASFRSTSLECTHAFLWVCRDSKQLPQASSGPSESAGSLTDNDGNASGSWLVDDAEDGGLGAPEGNNKNAFTAPMVITFSAPESNNKNAFTAPMIITFSTYWH